MSRAFVRVAKVGGSLFDCKRLPIALRSWLQDQPGVNVLIAGGGVLADFVRDADAKFKLGESTSHALCLRAMSLSAEMLGVMLPDSCFVRTLPALFEAIAGRQSSIIVFDVASFVETTSSTELPRTWAVTSDSIAVHVAKAIDAAELVLFKSTDLPPNTSRGQGSITGLVDSHFCQCAEATLAIRWVNLRNDPPTERPF